MQLVAEERGPETPSRAEEPRVFSRFDAGTKALETVAGIDLSGRVAMITGGAGGIGLEITRALVAAGAEVEIADIDDQASAAAAEALRVDYPAARIATGHLDLGSISAVRGYAADVLVRRPNIDILINNAGLMAPPLGRTADGHELQFGVNYLGHFVLTTGLMPALCNKDGARVVCVSSIGHRRADFNFDDPDYLHRPYERWEAYGQSKTACSLLAVALTERHGAEGVFANAVNPGGSMTGLQRHLSGEELQKLGWVDENGQVNGRWRSPAQCAATSTWLVSAPDLQGIGGRYFEECNEAEPWQADQPMRGVQPHALSRENATRLWDLSLAMTGN